MCSLISARKPIYLLWLIALQLCFAQNASAAGIGRNRGAEHNQSLKTNPYLSLEREVDELFTHHATTTNNPNLRDGLNRIYDKARSLQDQELRKSITKKIGDYIHNQLHTDQKNKPASTTTTAFVNHQHGVIESVAEVAPYKSQSSATEDEINSKSINKDNLSDIESREAESNQDAAQQAEQEHLEATQQQQLTQTINLRELLIAQQALSRQSKLLEQKIIALTKQQSLKPQQSNMSDPRPDGEQNATREKEKTINLAAISTLNQSQQQYFYKTSPRSRLEQAKVYIQDNNASKALQSLKDYTPSETERSEYYFLEGRAYQELKLNTKALSSYSIAIHEQNNHYRALNNRGLIKGALKDMRGAMDDLNRAINVKPDYAPAYLNRGVTRAAMQKTDLAIEDFTKALVLNPGYSDAYRNRGITYKYTGNLNGACRDWLKARNLGDSSVQSWLNRHCRQANQN